MRLCIKFHLSSIFAILHIFQKQVACLGFRPTTWCFSNIDLGDGDGWGGGLEVSHDTSNSCVEV